MWLDEKGVMHTCAFADPFGAIDEELAADVLRLVERDTSDIEEVLDRLEDELLETMTLEFDRNVEEAFREQWLPGGTLVGRASSLGELGDLLAAVDQRWRLDAILVMRDLVDEV